MRTNATAYPVALHVFYAFRPVNLIEVVNKSVCIICNLKKPLLQKLSFDFCATTIGEAIDHLLICKNCLIDWIPINQSLFLISFPFVKHLKKHPLRPFVVAGVAGLKSLAPVIHSTNLIYLRSHVRNILIGPLISHQSSLNGCVFCWQTK